MSKHCLLRYFFLWLFSIDSDKSCHFGKVTFVTYKAIRFGKSERAFPLWQTTLRIWIQFEKCRVRISLWKGENWHQVLLRMEFSQQRLLPEQPRIYTLITWAYSCKTIQIPYLGPTNVCFTIYFSFMCAPLKVQAYTYLKKLLQYKYVFVYCIYTTMLWNGMWSHGVRHEDSARNNIWSD